MYIVNTGHGSRGQRLNRRYDSLEKAKAFVSGYFKRYGIVLSIEGETVNDEIARFVRCAEKLERWSGAIDGKTYMITKGTAGWHYHAAAICGPFATARQALGAAIEGRAFAADETGRIVPPLRCDKPAFWYAPNGYRVCRECRKLETGKVRWQKIGACQESEHECCDRPLDGLGARRMAPLSSPTVSWPQEAAEKA